MSEWQDIATAPKDGTCVLIATADASDLRGFFVGYWDSEWDEWKFHREGIARHIVWWMPLPPLPSPAAPNTTDTEE